MSDKNLSWEDAVTWLKTQPDQIDLVRACFYDDPLIESARRYRDSSEWRAVREFLTTTGRALDLGAGRGIASYALAKDGWQVTALEPDSSAMVGANAIRGLAKESGLAIQVVEKWGEQLPFPEESFDLVHARAVLHHARDLRVLCGEAGRVLKKGGIFIATREHVITRREDLPLFLANHPLHGLYGGENAYLLDEYLAAIRAAGIRLSTVLNPFQSDINLYPETKTGLKRRIARQLGLPGLWVPDWVLSWLGRLGNAPGRLYTFVGRKE
jgi:SAM-dependent methyltransferase